MATHKHPSNRPNLTPANRNVVVEESFQGPIPSPDILQGYNGIDATFANRIMVMAEAEQIHRHNQEKDIAAHNIDFNNKRIELMGQKINIDREGSYIGLISVIIMASLCVYAFKLGYPVQAASIACVVIVALAGIFVLKQYNSPKQEAPAENKSA